MQTCFRIYHIPEHQIQALIDKWVPDGKTRSKSIPNDIMLTMISQFVAYGRGELSKEQLKDFPAEWEKKYWSFFPEEIQRLIGAYIRDRINKIEFWDSVKAFLG